MARNPTSIDVTDVPELRRVAEAVRDSQEPVVLRAGAREVAVVVPVAPHGPGATGKTQANREALLSAFGGWKGIVDIDQLKEDILAARGSDRPPVEL